MNDQIKLYEDYDLACASTAIYPRELELPYLALGLCSEVAELQGALDRHNRRARNGGSMVSTPEIMQELLSEAGDSMWYVTRLANFFDTDLQILIGAAKFRDFEASKNLLNGCILSMGISAGLIAGRAKKSIRDGANWSAKKKVENVVLVRDHLVDFIVSTLELTTTVGRLTSPENTNIGEKLFNRMLQQNMEKVLGRKERGTISGDGEHR